jgi:hypothetical protein
MAAININLDATIQASFSASAGEYPLGTAMHVLFSIFNLKIVLYLVKVW